MKLSPYPLKLAASILLASAIFYSCTKETSSTDLTAQEEEAASLATTQSEAEAEIIFNDVFDNVIGVNNEVGISGIGIFGRVATGANTERVLGCFTTTVTRLNASEPFPLRIEIDFGIGCPGRDGRVRSGKIVTEYTGRLIFPGKSATTSFVNYKVDSVQVEGSYTVSNTGSLTTRQFTIDVTNAKLTRPNGNYTRWNSHRVITQVEGMGTPDIYLDDVFTITGNSSGEIRTSKFATGWESNIIEPLRKRFGCQWISKGTVKVVRKNLSGDSKWAVVLNFGSGTCDNVATLTVNGTEHQIILH